MFWVFWFFFLQPYLCSCQEIDTVKCVNDKSLNKKDELVELPCQTEAEGHHVHQPHRHLLRMETDTGRREILLQLMICY